MFDFGKMQDALASASVLATKLEEIASRLEAIENLTREHNAIMAYGLLWINEHPALASEDRFTPDLAKYLGDVAKRGHRG